MRKVRVVLAGVGLTVILAACGNGPPPSVLSTGSGAGTTAATGGEVVKTIPATAAASIKATDDLKFDPAAASVKVGDTVIWTGGSVGHNVTFSGAQDALSDSTLNPGDKYAVKFTAAGKYAYECTIHPGMKGEIAVN